MFQHAFLKCPNLTGERLLTEFERLAVGRVLRGTRHTSAVGVIDTIDQFAYLLADSPRRDAMLGVELNLLLAPPIGFGDGALHGLGDSVGVEDGRPTKISGCASDCLDEASFRTEEALFVGIKYGHQRHFGDVQTFPEKVDTHQHIEASQPEVANDLDTLNGIDIRVQVADPHTVLTEEIRQVFSHSLGQGGDQHPITLGHPHPNLRQKILDLRPGGPDFDRRIDEPGGANHLLHHLTGRAVLVISGRGRHEYALPHFLLELIKP